jgi:hypothetical protein
MIRWLRNTLSSDDVLTSGSEQELWQAAARHAPFTYRWFRRTLSIQELDEKHAGWNAWDECRRKLQPGDLIWPFCFNRNTSAMRSGFVVIRAGRPVTGVVTIVS